MLDKMLANIRAHAMLRPGQRVLCALSGGADSMALFTALLALREQLDVYVAAAHFNHRLRGDASDADEAFVCAYGKTKGILVYTGRADVRAEAELNGLGLEEAARGLRYEFLRRVADEEKFQRIATAHTAGDNVETVLLNLARGTGLQGLCGIPPVRGPIIRPLLTVSREEVEAYLTQEDVPHVEDGTNSDLTLRRNRIRHEIVPRLCDLNPGLLSSVTTMTGLLRQDLDFFAGQTAHAMTAARRVPEGYAIDTQYLLDMHPALSGRVIRALCELIVGYPPDMAVGPVRDVLALCRSRDPSAQLSLPAGLTARRVYTDLVIGPAVKGRLTFAKRELTPDATLILPEIGMELSCRTVESVTNVHNSFNSFVLARDTLAGPLVVRPRREGDQIRLDGRPAKTLKKLFIEERVPERLRAAVPVLSDDAGVVAVAGFGADASRVGRLGQPGLVVAVRNSKRPERGGYKP